MIDIMSIILPIYRRMKRMERTTRRQDLQKSIEFNKSLAHQFEDDKENGRQSEKRAIKQWGLHSHMRKIEVKNDLVVNPSVRLNINQPVKSIRNWDYTLGKNKIVASELPHDIYYPPNCSGYDMAFSRFDNAIFVYGGISCASSLVDGIKPHFYRYSEGKWSEVRPDSTYNPTPRYGHTLTAYNKELILFGGVSEYKEKLKDRCFYTDCSSYHTVRNNWRPIETTGMTIKTRKNHSAAVYGKYYLVYGGLNESEQIINEVSWINLQCKKARWKYFPLQGRFNHGMVVVEPENGKDFLCLYGGRNSQAQIVNSMFFLPLTIQEGDLQLKDVVQIQHTIPARQMPLMGSFLDGFVILGGLDHDNAVVEDCWYCNNGKQTFTKIKLDISYDDLRGARGCTLSPDAMYLMAGNGQHYKALQLLARK